MGNNYSETTDSLEKIREKLDEIDSEIPSETNIINEIRKHDKKMTSLKFI